MDNKIIIHNVSEGNLNHIHVEIPRNQLVVLTGVSGSGKSTLAVDVLFNECQRQYLEAITLQGIRKPKLESLRNGSPAICISQNQTNKNPRSTVGTLTNIYTDLRMIYEKNHLRTCPHCGKMIESARCEEEVEKKGNDFKVFMRCEYCSHRMNKLTRTEFSYNTVEGACPKCEGLGKILSVNLNKVINEELSIEAGAVDLWKNRYLEYQIKNLYLAFEHYHIAIEPNTKIADYSKMQKLILYQGADCEAVKKAFPNIKPIKKVTEGKVEGIFPFLNRKRVETNGNSRFVEQYFDQVQCDECHGERLNRLSAEVSVMGVRLPELVNYSLIDLKQWIIALEAKLSQTQKALVNDYLFDLKTKLQRIIQVGLGYLSIDRQMITLSKGEGQRIKLAATLDCDLTGIIYIMDEPTMGLHPKDTQPIIQVLKSLRDKGNTVIVIEHDVDVMKEADYLIEMGPGAGKLGGEIIAQGKLSEVLQNPNSILASYMDDFQKGRKIRPFNQEKVITIDHANLNNLQDVHVCLPVGCLSCITGVSGSGKSTLIFEILANWQQFKGLSHNQVSGLEQFQQIIAIDQSALTRMKRSNVATYSGLFQELRTLFSKTSEALKQGYTINHFSFNSSGGRCPYCEGLGYIKNNLLFFEDQEIICPQCNGDQFIPEILAIQYLGYSIKDILSMSINDIMEVFSNHPKIKRIASLLQDVGLGYLELKQTLTTLSAGEGQRLKLARCLLENRSEHCLYLLDEPTIGLHPQDIKHFLVLIDRMIDQGNTVVGVEHNLQFIKNADWIIDLGPEGGMQGGKIIAQGTCLDLSQNIHSVTGKFLM